MQKAKWIWKDHQTKPDDYARFYDNFNYTNGTVYLDISCDSNYELYINGKIASFGQYSDYPYDKVFDKIDITNFCIKGNNQIEILVWYVGVGNFTYYVGLPGLIYEAYTSENTLCYSCEKTLCDSAQEYQSGLQKYITEQMGFSYRYYGKSQNSIQEKKNAVLVSNRPTSFRIRPIKKLQCKSIKEAKCINPIQEIYDLGEETVGYLSIDVMVPKGTMLTIAWGEHLVENNGIPSVPQLISVRDFSVEIVGNGEKVQFANYLRRIGGRYFQLIHEKPIELYSIGLIPVMYPVQVLPFSCQDSLRKRIYDVAVHTLRCCMFEHYEDCPWREQSLYNLDSRNQMLFGYDAFMEYEFPRASLELYGKDHREDGMLSMCVPSQHDLVIPFFSLFWIVQMEEYATHSKDTSLIEKYMEKMENLLILYKNRMNNGLIPVFDNDIRYWNFYEWNDKLKGQCHKLQPYGFDLVLNCTFSIAMQKMHNMQKMIGYQSIDWYKEAKSLNEAICAFFYREKDGLFQNSDKDDTYSILGNSFAILCGAADSIDAKCICKKMISDTSILPATLSMKCFQYDALLKVDRTKYKDFVLTDIDRIFGKMLDCGATSFWETEKGAEDFHNAGSLCHGWSALPIHYYKLLL